MQAITGAYSSTAQTDPKGPPSGTARVLRGGSFIFNDSVCLVALRSSYPAGGRDIGYDFRCVRD
jgi:formylglycine-generating enzyme required for sulfatase activity